MGLHIRTTGSDDYGKYIKALICGPPGAGKTLTASTWKNPFYASAEAGLMSIADRNIPYMKVEEIDDLLHLKILLDQNPADREEMFGFPIDTLVVDTLDEIQRMLIRERLEATKQEALRVQDWGYIGETMSAMARGLRNLDINVVFLLHLKEVNDADSGRLYWKPQLQGQFADQVPGMVDLSLLLRTATTTQVVENAPRKVVTRYLQTVPDANHDWVKDRSGKLPPEVPINFTDDYERIYGFIYGGLATATQSEERVLDVQVSKLDPQPAQVQRKPATRPVKGNRPTSVLQPTQNTPDVGKIGPLNTLPNGIVPQSKGFNTNFYCESCGAEVETQDRVDLSRIKYRKVYCNECFKTATTATTK